jgi:hypothetical protein
MCDAQKVWHRSGSGGLHYLLTDLVHERATLPSPVLRAIELGCARGQGLS